jgi:hypothetical protein
MSVQNYDEKTKAIDKLQLLESMSTDQQYAYFTCTATCSWEVEEQYKNLHKVLAEKKKLEQSIKSAALQYSLLKDQLAAVNDFLVPITKDPYEGQALDCDELIQEFFI